MYEFGSTHISNSGIYYNTLESSYCVDSIVKLDLTVMPDNTNTLDTILCKGETLKIGDSIVISESGFFDIKLKSNFGCDSTILINIDFDDLEVVDSIIADYGCGNGIIDLALEGNNHPYTFNWSNGEYTENLSSLKHGNYSVTINDKSNCVYKFEYFVPDSLPYLIPNAFFPSHQDEINTTFKIYTAKDVKVISIEIYNRWGERVFQTVKDEYWDGTYRGKLQSPGVFLYKIEIDSPCGLETKSGQVLLLK